MNLLKEIVYGKEGLAEREHKKHPSPTIASVEPTFTAPIQPVGQNLPESNVTVKQTTTKVNITPLENQLAHTHLEEDVESALEHIKREEIREGIQTIESTREPVNFVTVPKEAVIQEHIHPVEKVEVQPVVHRDRQQMEVHQIVQPISESEVLPPVIEEKELPPQFIGEFVENDALSQEQYVAGNSYHSSVDVDGVRRIRIIKEPIVEEVIHKTIIEEVQPVIHKETIAPHIIKETLPLYEKVVEAPVIVQEQRSELIMGTKLPEETRLPLDAELIHKLQTHQEDPHLFQATTSATIEKKNVI
jgi:hypothetical protein